MDTTAALSLLAELRALSPDYIDFKGNFASVPIQRQAGILRTMGYDTEGEALQKAVRDLQFKTFQHGIPTTIVLRPNGFFGFHCRAALEAQGHSLDWTVTLEMGGQLNGSSVFGVPIALSTDKNQSDDSSQLAWADYQVPFTDAIPLGYHQLTVRWGDSVYEAALIQTPESGFIPDTLASDKRIWGPSIQLYTLRTARNWGMGDFSDLCSLIEQAASQGAGFIGLNPLHALYSISPEHASPYSPSNRSMLNVLYIDPEAVSEFRVSEACQSWFSSAAVCEALAAARDTKQVDYSAVHRLKWHAFDLMFDSFVNTHVALGTARSKKFLAFVEKGGEALQTHCLFEALLAHFHHLDADKWGWPQWASPYKDRQSDEVLAFESSQQDAIQKYQYLQFVAAEQLEAASLKTNAVGMALGLYRDLAVGADRGGSEVWQDPTAFCLEASIGAPPDALGPVGQNWGLPPLDPWHMTATHYQHFIQLIRSNMASCGALRIDHAMALARLWWCPPGQTAAEGCYVAYPLEDLLGILLLESQRQQCLVIAEDLGTVPDNVKAAFPRAGLFSNKVFYFEMDEMGCTLPSHYPNKALAIVANHDMPTLTAFWSGADLALRQSLGMFVDNSVYQLEQQRRQLAKHKVVTALKTSGFLSEAAWQAMGGDDALETSGMTLTLSAAIHQYLASTPTQLVAVQLEDMLLIESPVNVPGTSLEYANWRRKMTENIETLFSNSQSKQFCEGLNRTRLAE